MTVKRQLQAKDLYRLRLLSDAQISPDACRVAFVLKTMDEEKNEYLSNIHVAERDGSVTQYTAGDKDSAPRWSPDGKYLAFLSGRKEKTQIHLLSTHGGEGIALTDRKFGAGVPVWSPDSTTIAFSAPVPTNPEEEQEEDKKDDKKPAPTKIVDRSSYKADGAGFIGNRRNHIFTVDVASKKTDQITEGDFHSGDPSWSPDSRHIAFNSNRSPRWDVSTEGAIYVIPRTGGQARKVTEGGAFFHPVFSPDGSRIGFMGNEDPNEIFAPSRLYSVNRAGDDLWDMLGDWDGSLGNDVSSDIVHSAEDSGTALIWREDGIYFIATERGESNIYRTDGAVQSVTTGQHAIPDFSMAEDGTLAYVVSDTTHPAEIYLKDGDQVQQLTHENDAFLEEVRVFTPERISFTGANGETSEGWLLAPPGHESGKHPLIVYIHGGPQTAHGEGFFFEYQFLAGQGFGVFFPNIHGSSSYGRAYQTSIRHDWGNQDYQDVLAGTETAAAQPWVDERRLGIAGGSYGGYMTGWVMGHTDRFQAAVMERCLCNMVSFMGTSDGGWVWDRQFGVFPEDDVQKIWDMSPLKYVGNVQAPMMVIHSERDDRTPFEQGEQMFNALRRLGKDTKFVIFPEESHGLSRGGKPSRRVERLGYIADWFREKL